MLDNKLIAEKISTTEFRTIVEEILQKTFGVARVFTFDYKVGDTWLIGAGFGNKCGRVWNMIGSNVKIDRYKL